MSFLKFFAIKQIILFIIQTIALLTVTIISIDFYLEQHNQQQKKLVHHFITQNISDDPKILARQLQNNFTFDTLVINNIQGDALYRYSSRQNSSPQNHNTISKQLLNLMQLLPKPVDINHQSAKLRLQFQLSFQQQLLLIDKLILQIIAICAFIALLNLLVSKQILRRIYKYLATNISSNIEIISEHAQNEKSPTAQSLNLRTIHPNLQPINSALIDLQRHIAAHINKITDNAEQAKSDALIDELTGLPNRNRFVEFFEKRLKINDGLNFGCLAVVRCSQLQEINQSRGYQAGDIYVSDIVKLLQQSADAFDDPSIYRLNGSDFAIILPSIALNDAERFATSLQAKLNQYQRSNELDSAAYTGLIRYHGGNHLGELLALTDTAISIAQTKQANSYHAQTEADLLDNASASYGNQSWRQVIEYVIENKTVSLLSQTIIPSNINTKTFTEILTRFINKDGQTLPTTAFFAMAEKLDLVCQLEQMIIEVALDTIKSPNKNQQKTDHYTAINLTPRSAHDSQFITWLERRLQKEPDIAKRLTFEVSEYGLQQNIKDSKRFIDMAHRVGAKVTVERFGLGLTSFKFFRELKPDHIKMDGSYTKDLDTDNNNQYFLHQIIELAHRIDVCVFAEIVETSDEKHALEKLAIDGLQGYYFGKPEAL